MHLDPGEPVTTTPEPPSDFIAAIARGDFICVRQAADRLQIGYWTVWRRLRREEIPTHKLRGRRYLRAVDLENPALRVA
jgi:hypothetical protein